MVACGLRYGCFGILTKLVHCPRSKNTRAVFTSLVVLSKMTTTTNRHFSNQRQKWSRLWIWMVWCLCDLKKGEGHVMATKPKTVFFTGLAHISAIFSFFRNSNAKAQMASLLQNLSWGIIRSPWMPLVHGNQWVMSLPISENAVFCVFTCFTHGHFSRLKFSMSGVVCNLTSKKNWSTMSELVGRPFLHALSVLGMHLPVEKVTEFLNICY